TCCGHALSGDALLGVVVQPADVQRCSSHDGHVLICMTLAYARAILIEDHIEYPMHLVLHAPVLSDPGAEALGISFGTGDIEAYLFGRFSTSALLTLGT